MGHQPSPDPESVPAPAPENSSPQSSAAFDAKAQAWDKYTDTPLGRLRQELIQSYLRQPIGSLGSNLSILDVGGGTGNYSLPLVQQGHRVCLLDFSPAMLDIARSKAGQLNPDAAKRIEFRCASVQEIPELFPTGLFDVVLCHTLLEYVSEPWLVLKNLVAVLRPGGLLSLVIVNHRADPLRWAIAKSNLDRALLALHETVSSADLFGLPRHTLAAQEMQEALSREGVQIVAAHGVRIFADYLPSTKLRDRAFYERLAALESAASTLDPYRAIARYTHMLGKSQLERE